MTDTSNQKTAVWPILTYRDAPAAMEFLTNAFGFEERAAHTREDDPSVIEHAEMRWPLGGGIMFGTAGKDDSPFGTRVPGNDSVYVVCDDPDALFDRAVAAGRPSFGALRTRTTARAASPSVTPKGTCGASAPTPVSERRSERVDAHSPHRREERQGETEGQQRD